MSTTIREAWPVRDGQRGKIVMGKRLAMDMPNESVRGENIMAAVATPSRPPFPPFTRESAMEKVRLAEDAWNSRDPAK